MIKVNIQRKCLTYPVRIISQLSSLQIPKPPQLSSRAECSTNHKPFVRSLYESMLFHN